MSLGGLNDVQRRPDCRVAEAQAGSHLLGADGARPRCCAGRSASLYATLDFLVSSRTSFDDVENRDGEGLLSK
jgi:hypothetical protein